MIYSVLCIICCIILNKNNILIYVQFHPSEAIRAGIATAIKPTAAVAVSNDVLTTFKTYAILI